MLELTFELKFLHNMLRDIFNDEKKLVVVSSYRLVNIDQLAGIGASPSLSLNQRRQPMHRISEMLQYMLAQFACLQIQCGQKKSLENTFMGFHRISLGFIGLDYHRII